MENGKIVIYRTADGETSIDVKLENDTVWLTQAQMAELFQKDQSVIARHIRNVFKEGELEEILKSATPFPKCYLHKEEWTFDS